MKPIYWLVILTLVLVSCAQAPVIQTVEVTRIIAHTVEVPVAVPQTVVVTRQVEVVITATLVPDIETPTPDLTQQANSIQEIMNGVISRTKHFRGDADAPVTIIEFSDYQ